VPLGPFPSLACYTEVLTLIRFDRRFIGRPIRISARERPLAMPATDRLWEFIKATAGVNARQGAILTMPASRKAILKICRQRKASPPSPETLNYLATELVRLTLEKQFPS
jgi:hypothetical protein